LVRPCSPGAYGRFSRYLAAFGVSAMPSARDRRVLLRVRDLVDTGSLSLIVEGGYRMLARTHARTTLNPVKVEDVLPRNPIG
jgi:hypothetical protein